MIFTKDLILKGVAGLTAISGLGIGGFYVWNQNQEESLQSLAEKVGLNCTETPTRTTGVGCEIKEDGGLSAKQDTNKQTGKKKSNTQTNNAGTIKAYKVEASGDRKGGFKFVIEDGDIELTNGGGPNKLEQFETYEIEEDGGTHYLTRKTKVSDKIEADLALPEGCKFSTENISCTDVEITTSNIGAINFVGKDDNNQPQLTSGTAIVTVTKETSNPDFPYGYKFSLKGKETSATITVGSTTYPLKQNQPTEFRIKKTETGNSTTFSLEKTWTLETLTEKVGLECAAGATPTATTGVQCNKKDGSGNIKVKQDETTFDLSAISGGKIKVYKDEDSENYNQDLKFVIEDGNITSGNNKLEQFETYEIKKETGNQWYLSRKNESWMEKRKLLGFPQEDACKFPDHTGTIPCILTEDKLKKINFEDKGSGETTIDNASAQPNTDLKLKITVTTSGEEAQFPYGYKFSLESNRDISFPETSKSIKKNTNTEFRIKKAASGNALTLEKAWTVTTLGQKVGLTCNTEGEKECTLNDGNINVNNGGNNKHTNLSKKAGEEKKVKFEEDKDGYSQGFKFYVDGSEDICLQTNGESGDDNKKIEKKTGGSSEITYEIKKSSDTSDNNWYLTKKTGAGA